MDNINCFDILYRAQLFLQHILYTEIRNSSIVCFLMSLWHLSQIYYCYRELSSPWNVCLPVIPCYATVVQNHLMTSVHPLYRKAVTASLWLLKILKKTNSSKVFGLTFAFFSPTLHTCYPPETRIHFIPLRSIWFAAMSITLMMNAMAKAQIRLLRTHVCFSCCVGLAVEKLKRKEISRSECFSRDKKKRKKVWNRIF